jgi:hypothetical protein
MGLRLETERGDLKISTFLVPILADLGLVKTKTCRDGSVVMCDTDAVKLSRQEVETVLRRVRGLESWCDSMDSYYQMSWLAATTCLEAWLETDEQIAVFC